MAATVNYRAPEALFNDYSYNYKIDIWALGLIIYFMVSGSEFISKEYLDSEVKLGKYFEIFDNIKRKIFERFVFDWEELKTFASWEDKYGKMFDFWLNKTFVDNCGKYADVVMSCVRINPGLRADAGDLLKLL